MIVRTVTIIIGNTDGKLHQSNWQMFCNEITRAIRFYTFDLETEPIQFSAPSIGWERYQNACWVILVPSDNLENLRKRVSEIGKNHKQESIAWVVGITEFI